MISALEVSEAGDGEMFKRDKMGRVRVSRAQREALFGTMINKYDDVFDSRIGDII
jgi:hypothetical protein